jgi:hypothetical protein
MEPLTVKRLMEYLSKSDPEAIIFIETEQAIIRAYRIIEDRTGITISSTE